MFKPNKKNLLTAIILVGVTCLPTLALSDANPPANIHTEKITFAINEDYAAKNADWQDRAQEIIDFANTAFGETNIRYEIEQYKTFTVDYKRTINNQMSEWLYDKDTHFLNTVNADEKPFSTTIYLTVIDSSKDPNIFSSLGGVTGTFSKSEQISDNGQEYFSNVASIFQDINPAFAYSATILGAEKVAEYFPENWTSNGHGPYESQNQTLIHELGHSFGLGNPENYLFNDNIDNSNTEPILEGYDFDGIYKKDSMGSYMTETYFNDFNTKLINDNPHHQRSTQYLSDISYDFKVRVVNANNIPIPNTEVKIFAARTTCGVCSTDPSKNNLPSPLLGTFFTDNTGLVQIGEEIWTGSNSSRAPKYVTNIVKINYNNKYAGNYVSYFDIQFEKLYNNKQDYELKFILDTEILPSAPTSSAPTPTSEPEPESIPTPVSTPTQSPAPLPEERNIKDNNLYNQLKGKIILKVESNGEAYYIHPTSKKSYFLGRPNDAFRIMREQGIGISNVDLEKIPIGLSNLSGSDTDGDGLSDAFEDAIGTNKNNTDTDGDGHNDKTEVENGYNPKGPGRPALNQNFTSTQSGKIFIQVEAHGEAWYVYGGKRHFLGRPADAFAVMRELGLGISNENFNKLN